MVQFRAIYLQEPFPDSSQTYNQTYTVIQLKQNLGKRNLGTFVANIKSYYPELGKFEIKEILATKIYKLEFNYQIQIHILVQHNTNSP